MMNVLLFVHIVIAILLIIVILLQKTGVDSLSGIGGGGNNMGIVSARSAANFLTKMTIILASLFFVNAIVLANLSSKKKSALYEKVQEIQEEKKEEGLPIK